MHELTWMALLKYFQLKSTSKKPLPNPNGEMIRASFKGGQGGALAPP